MEQQMRALIEAAKYYCSVYYPGYAERPAGNPIIYTRLQSAISAASSALEHSGWHKFSDVDKSTWFYKNCKRQRRNNAKICQVCPFREGIEKQEISLPKSEA